MKLLLVTGAGSSRNLGANQTLMPLMPDWAKALVHELNEKEAGLAQACQLRSNMDGPEFESAVGRLFQWRAAQPLQEDFKSLGALPLNNLNTVPQDFLARTQQRLDAFQLALSDTLHDLFRPERIDEDAAASAYRTLFDALGDPDVAIATTNYDRAIETALGANGRGYTIGMTNRVGRTPVLDAGGFLKRAGAGVVPVIHLHGAQGWYRQGDLVRDFGGDADYNNTLGAPAVLYPDPDKDPAADEQTAQLWGEFDEALEWCDHVLVLGHSLHDRHLVSALQSAINRKVAVAVTYYDDSELDSMRTALGNSVTFLQMDFGPKPQFDRDEFKSWAEGTAVNVTTAEPVATVVG